MFLDMASWKAALLLAMHLSYIPIASTSPLTPHDQSIKAVISSRSATSNLDILTPNENGELVRSSTSLRERQQPGDVTYIGDGKCASSTFSATSFSCGLFCTTQTIVAKGAAQKASADINCQTTGCSAAVTQTTTIFQLVHHQWQHWRQCRTNMDQSPGSTRCFLYLANFCRNCEFVLVYADEG